MPTCRRKRVMLKELTSSLLEDAQKDPSTPVFYMEQTGEIFTSYESYAARLSFYKLKQFQCEVTGKSGLDYFQALESEQQEARTLHARFPQPLKAPVLRAVQWQVIGRLDHLVEAVYERFKDRYFEGERVYIDVQGDRYWARVVKVFPPRTLRTRASSSTSDSISPPSDDEIEPHRVSGDLKQPIAQLNATDDPKSYYYKVQLIEEGLTSDLEYFDAKGKGKVAAKWDASLMEVQSEVMSRDRLSFSKSILRRFIRDCVDRDAAVASPWTVKRPIADKYGVENVMPEETRKGVQEVKNKEIEKRKKVWEDKEGPPSKKQKKLEERALKGHKADEDDQRGNEEAAREPQEKHVTPTTKKRYIKYPTEDLDVVLSQREKAKRVAANGHANSVRPLPNTDVPFGMSGFESLLMSWSFFTAFGTPLKLSSFTLDELEHAIKHSDPDQPVTLIAEIHSSLIYALRALSTHRHLAVLSLLEESDEIDEDEGVRTEELTDALAEIGNNWERQPLRADEGRFGWEEAMIGCIKDQATVASFPTLRRVLTRLLFTFDTPETSVQDTATPDSTTAAAPAPPPPPPTRRRANPGERYYLLPPEDKIAILAFLCDAVVSHKEIHLYMESCENNLTQLRKEKIEVKKERKKIQEEMAALAKDDILASNDAKESDAKETKETKELKETKEAKEPKETKEAKEPKEPKEPKETKDAKEVKDAKDKEAKDKEAKEAKDKEIKEIKEVQEVKETKEVQEVKETKEPQDGEADRMDVESELSDVESDALPPSDLEGSETETVSGAERTRPPSGRQKSLRLKMQGPAHAKQREIARAKTASAKQAQAEHRRLDEEDNKLDRRMESIEREFRKWSGVVRLRPLGKDRFHNRYWWFDGIGCSSLIASGGTVVYGAGRLFIQGPTEGDIEIMERKQKEDPPFDLVERRLADEGPEGMLAVGAWGYYSDPEQFAELMAWLNVKGNRELKLKENLTKWADHIACGIRKRLADLAINAKLPEARRSTRGKNTPDVARHYEPYLLWQNKKAPSMPA